MKRALSRKNMWDKLPQSIKQGIGWTFALIPPRYLLGKGFRKQLAFVDNAQWWPKERVRDYQLAQLRKICTLAYEKTLFYQGGFKANGFEPDDLKSLEDLAGLDTINRNTVSEHLHRMCAVSSRSGRVDRMSTGGTSGKPLHFYIGRDRSAIEYAYLVASWQRVGYQLGIPMAVFRGRVVAENRNGLYHMYDPTLRHHYYSNFHMSDENMHRYLSHVATVGPCFLHVYPSSIAALARFIKRTGAPVPTSIRGIIAESEIVYPDQRKMVEEVFGCRYFSCYGHSEKLVLAAECEHSTDYHVWPTYGYFELLDDNDQPVTTPGKRGEIVGTGFINNVVPFIRYRTGDYATYVADRCEACGREDVIIRDIRGHRTQEFLIAADGSEISWTALNMHDDTFMNVRQFQFCQRTPGEAVLRIVPADGFGDNDRQRVLRQLGRKLEGRINVTIELADGIPLSRLGKAIYVDQQIA